MATSRRASGSSSKRRRGGSPDRPGRGRWAGAALLLGPTALAFFAGGYFTGPRRVALVVAWGLALAGVAALVPTLRWIRASPARMWALSGLALFAGWTFLSARWARIPSRATPYGELALLYLGALIAAAMLTRDARCRRLVEPALAAGALVVILYGLSERWLPGMLHFRRTRFSQGRLEQPLTYWNAEAELAALGLVLCARIAGDGERPRPLRMAAAAACVPLGAGLALSVSRGGLVSAGIGLAALVLIAPRYEQLRAVILAVASAVAGALAVIPIGGTRWIEGPLAARERTGLFVLTAIVAVGAVSAGGARTWVVRGRAGELGISRWARIVPAALIVLALAASVAIGTATGTTGRETSGPSRLVTTNSIRYAYWRIAVRAFVAEPVHGVGAGGWADWWEREREGRPPARDAHSLPLQTAAELGLIGLGLLGAFIGGVMRAGRAVLRADPSLAAGPLAGCVVYLAHAPLDWDWEMPAVTLVAIILAGTLLGAVPNPRTAAGDGVGSVTN